ncbi:hypothetical protein R3X27_06075 [Tropicimonas sp. TH_r6]|nr:hypothetical protein [Tropicimonas sp. TH_r6]MDV7142243.1 hypothetical protein [Tropicimonas sp. TH_r6]
MKTEKRWLKSVLIAAEECDFQMPWERGARRDEMILRREQRDAPEALRA